MPHSLDRSLPSGADSIMTMYGLEQGSINLLCDTAFAEGVTVGIGKGFANNQSGIDANNSKTRGRSCMYRGTSHRKFSMPLSNLTMMKTIFTILLVILPLGVSFSPSIIAKTSTTRLVHSDKVGEIEHELQELGAEIKPHVSRNKHAHGFEAKDSVVHKLRRELRSKDKLYHELLDEMEQIERRQLGMADMKTVLRKTLIEVQQQNAMLRHKKEVSKQQQDTLYDLLGTIKKVHDDMVKANVFALAWEATEVELWREKQQHAKLDKDRESVRTLLWQATKLVGRRIKRVFRRILFLKD